MLVVLVSVCIARNETRVGSKHHARMLGNKHSSDQKSDAGPGPASHYISGTTGVLFTGEKETVDGRLEKSFRRKDDVEIDGQSVAMLCSTV